MCFNLTADVILLHKKGYGIGNWNILLWLYSKWYLISVSHI